MIVRAVAVASAILVVAFTVLQPFDDPLPRSVVVMDFLLTLMLVAGARLAVRLIVERPSRGDRVPKHEVLVVGAGSGGQMVVRELQLNPRLGVDRDRLRRRRPAQAGDADARASRCWARPRRSTRSSTRPSPTRS